MKIALFTKENSDLDYISACLVDHELVKMKKSNSDYSCDLVQSDDCLQNIICSRIYAQKYRIPHFQFLPTFIAENDYHNVLKRTTNQIITPDCKYDDSKITLLPKYIIVKNQNSNLKIADFQRKHFLDNDEFVLLYMGPFTKRAALENILYLLPYFDLPKVKIIFAGNGKQYKFLKTILDDFHFKNVFLMPKEDEKYYKIADATILAHYDESIALKSFYYGVPVIYPYQSQLENISIGNFAYQTRKELLQAIRTCYEQRHWLKTQREKIATQIPVYTQKDIALKLEKIYQIALDSIQDSKIMHKKMI